MAKKTRVPTSSATTGKPVPAKTMAEILALMSELTEIVVQDFFFDPEREDLYTTVLKELKTGKLPEIMLHVMRDDIAAGECVLKLFALRERSWFRVFVDAPRFDVGFEAFWDFDDESVSATRAHIVSGPPSTIAKGLDELAEVMSDSMLSEEEFADLLDFNAGSPDGEHDDIDTPPPPTPADRHRVTDIARRLSRQARLELPDKDRVWLEETPQALPLILDSFIDAAAKPGADFQSDAVLAYTMLFSIQLEFVRYRLDDGRSWAADLIEAVQERMVRAAEEGEIPADAWMLLAKALTQSRVPVSEAMRQRLAAAGLGRDLDDLPGDLDQALRVTLETIAESGATPFQVVDSFRDAGAVIPPAMRCYIATELSLSPHAVMRASLPLLLLDDDAPVRRHVAQALTQSARPDTMSGETLRRLIGIRNWLPPDDRPELDTAIRTARLAGVQSATWPATPEGLEVYASLLDGSSAQSIVFVHRPPRKKGSVSGVLVRHGTGIRDVWLHQDLSRAEIADLLRSVTQELGGIRVDADYAGRAIQHGIASGLNAGTVPPISLLELAETVGAHEWQDRQIDIAAEIDATWNDLPATDRSADGTALLLRRAAQWMDLMPIFLSWFEGGPAVEKRYRKMARTRLVPQLLSQELETRRMAWAERFLLAALCYQASPELGNRGHAAEFIVAAKALAGTSPVASIPPMVHIANTTADAIASRGR